MLLANVPDLVRSVSFLKSLSFYSAINFNLNRTNTKTETNSGYLELPLTRTLIRSLSELELAGEYSSHKTLLYDIADDATLPGQISGNTDCNLKINP